MPEQMIDLTKLYAFEAWAKRKGYDLQAQGDGNFVDPLTAAAWDGFSSDEVIDLELEDQPKLVARIREDSKYAHQAEMMMKKGDAYPFPVAIVADAMGYVVAGGLGGCYRLVDVDLYAVVDGTEISLSVPRKKTRGAR
ncbi:hypothetical protein [Pseudomonas sp. Marseille-Q5115]|uniref:hypothetical protein n=1 Tax=Pseudomonas sp. Marseille-Q5115 TaxID=2866593 RepID=UPI001CE45307|nr:hypothetical protein [Pseudomonas sp. Marseille-Q5115]